MTENTAETSMPQVKRSGSKRPASADQERLVRRYLSAVETAKPGRGVKRAADAVSNRITKVDELLVSADPLARVHLIQERIELHAEYVRLTNANAADPSQLERDFVRVVRSYGDRNGITYAAWRQVGVDASVLEQAGIRKAEKKAPPAAIRAAKEASEMNGRAQESAGKAEADTPTTGPSHAGNGSVIVGPDTTGSVTTGPETTGPEATEPPSAEVSLDELADLLAEAGSGLAPGGDKKSDQPSLGDDFETTPSGPSDAGRDRPRRAPRATGS